MKIIFVFSFFLMIFALLFFWRSQVRILAQSPAPTNTGAPTPTSNPNCSCIRTIETNIYSCSAECKFDEYPNFTYQDPILCQVPDNLFVSPPDQNNRSSWCQRSLRSKGDADGLNGADNIDYYYYVAAVNGGQIPSFVNPDFNGDGQVGVSDRAIIIQTLNASGG